MEEFPSAGTVAWWDKAASAVAMNIDGRMLETGRRGERETIAYEEERTGRKPKWLSIESNWVGYDILSSADKGDWNPRIIEVKSSYEDVDHAVFYLSATEWEALTEAYGQAYVYIWSFAHGRELSTIPAAQLSSFIPIDQHEGKWQSVQIPFSAFKGSFDTIS